MISYDEDLLEALYEAAEDNPFMDYAALSRWYSEGDGLTDYEMLKVREGLEEHRREVRQRISESTVTSEEEIEQSVEDVDFDIGSELEEIE